MDEKDFGDFGYQIGDDLKMSKVVPITPDVEVPELDIPDDEGYELAETLIFKAKCGHDSVWIVASSMGQAVEMAEENFEDKTDYYDIESVSLQGAAIVMSRPSDNEENI